LLQTTWQTDDPAEILLAQQRAFNLIDLFQECGAPGPGTPFACAGDLGASSAPYGTWTLGCMGTYLSGTGYAGDNGSCSGHNYLGIFLDIVFANAINIDNLHLVYDMTPGFCDDPGDVSGVHVVDVTNSADMGTPIHVCAVPSGTGLAYNAPGVGAPTSHLIVVMARDVNPPRGIGTGSVTLRQAYLSGTAGSSGILPC
jgi:hypothetical protein